MDRVFRRNKQPDDINKVKKKFLAEKESSQRFKYLRKVIATSSSQDLLDFFNTNKSIIFDTFIDAYISIENDKGGYASAVELYSVLSVFENILFLNSDAIERKWQFHIVFELFTNLLNPKNTIIVIQEGIRLFLAWYQILGSNAPCSCHDMFINLVPDLGPVISAYQDRKNATFGYANPASQGSSAVAYSVEVRQPVLFTHSTSNDGDVSDLSRTLFQSFLEYLAFDTFRRDVRTDAKMQQVMQFWFIFERLKHTYLPVIFPHLSPQYSIYEPETVQSSEVDNQFSEVLQHYPISPNRVNMFQEDFILWLTSYITTTTPRFSESMLGDATSPVTTAPGDSSSDAQLTEMDSNVGGSLPSIHRDSDSIFYGDSYQRKGSAARIPITNHKNLLYFLSNKIDDLSARDSEMPQFYPTPEEVATVHAVIYGCRQNINLLHDIFRHAFHLPAQCINAVAAVVRVYISWIENEFEKPVFMRARRRVTRKKNSDPTPSAGDSSSGHAGDSSNEGQEMMVTDASMKIDDELRGCLQTTIQVILHNISKVFQLTCPPAVNTMQKDKISRSITRTIDYAKLQVQLCNSVLRIFRSACNNKQLSSETWSKLLSILLSIMRASMTGRSPSDANKDCWLSNKPLIEKLFQTMNVALLRATLHAPISAQPWDQCMAVYSQLTNWPSLITEWRKAMEKLTAILVKLVYGVDLDNLPKEKKPVRRFIQALRTPTKEPPSHVRRPLFNKHQNRRDAEGSQRSYRREEEVVVDEKVGNSNVEKKKKSKKKKERNGEDGDDDTADDESTSLRLVSSLEYDDLLESSQAALKSQASKQGQGWHSPNQLDYSPRSGSTDDLHSSGTLTSTSRLRKQCLMAGGQVCGWTKESVFACWRRFLGLLGDFNKMALGGASSRANLDAVYVYFADLTNTLLKVYDNQKLPAVSESNVRPLPSYLVPVHFICPVLFSTFNSEAENVDNLKLSAISTLSHVMIQAPYGNYDLEAVAQFYRLLHRILADTPSSSDALRNQVIRCSGAPLFTSTLPSLVLLVSDFLRAVSQILGGSSPSKEVPYVESVQLVISLLCYPDTFGSFPVLDPMRVEPQTISCADLKTQLVSMLIQAAQSVPNSEARCLALTGLVVHCSVGLLHSPPNGHFLYECVVVLLGMMMQLTDLSVTLVAVDMILTLADHCDSLLSCQSDLPCLIIRSLAWNLNSHFTIFTSGQLQSVHQAIIKTIINAMVTWTLRLPSSEISSTPLHPTGDTNTSTLSIVLSLLSGIVSRCGSTSDSRPGDEQTILASMSNPLVDCVSRCRLPVDLSALSSSPVSHLDSSDLAIKSFLMSSFGGHPWMGIDLNQKNSQSILRSIGLSARFGLSRLINHLDHFPVSQQLDIMGSAVHEAHDQPSVGDGERVGSGDTCTRQSSEIDDQSELTAEHLFRDNLQIFAIDQSILLTLISLPVRQADAVSASLYPTQSLAGITDGAERNILSDLCYTRVIVRDAFTKYSWDFSSLYSLPGKAQTGLTSTPSAPVSVLPDSLEALGVAPPEVNCLLSSNDPVHVGRSTDFLENILCDLQRASPPCAVRFKPSRTGCYSSDGEDDDDDYYDCIGLTGGLSSPDGHAANYFNMCSSLEKLVLDQIVSQLTMDRDTVVQRRGSLLTENPLMPVVADSTNYFSNQLFKTSRHLLNQLGLFSWNYRPRIDLLQKSRTLARELKHLDTVGPREMYKIAVFYVAAGKEDKASILSTQAASLEFEQFVAGLGWEVELATHRGFRGGLEPSGQVGKTTPYYATESLEVLFHVSSRMPPSTQGDFKYRHLGNDEVMIIWNENSRSFGRNVLLTNFGDVVIVITPNLNGLFRVEIRRKSNVGFFGPIAHDALLDASVLPFLVRATAINANRAIRTGIPTYRESYEYRSSALKEIFRKYTLPCSFEDFSQHLFPEKAVGTARSVERRPVDSG